MQSHLEMLWGCGANVGADLSGTSPIYRPGKGIDEPLADKSAVRQ